MATYTVLFSDGSTAMVRAWDISEAWERALEAADTTIVDVWQE